MPNFAPPTPGSGDTNLNSSLNSAANVPGSKEQTGNWSRSIARGASIRGAAKVLSC
jgi:hypothetical protein